VDGAISGSLAPSRLTTWRPPDDSSRQVTKVLQKISFGFLGMILALGLAGCGHKLVAHNGETTVNVYATREQFDKVESMKSQGGPVAMLGGLGESMLARKIDNDTPVKIISSDEKGASIEVLDGRDKGLKGYVAKDNLD
jgi:hypothetical protein